MDPYFKAVKQSAKFSRARKRVPDFFQYVRLKFTPETVINKKQKRL